MREIKYRAWEKNLKEIIPVYNIDFEKKMINTESAWRTFEEIELLQYTGFTDKNGKEIYEGDIVDYGAFNSSVIKYQDGAFWARIGQYPMNEIDEYEVLGNIYENPDRLGDTH